MNKHTTGLTNIVVLGAALTVGLLIEVAHGAEPGAAAPVKVVTYKDLDINTDAGVKLLYKRIQRAANEVCGDFEIRDPQRVQAHNACVHEAMDQAAVEVNNRMLTQRVAVAQVR